MKRCSQAGFSLMEVILASVLSLIVVWQIFNVYQLVIRMHRAQADLSEIAHQGRTFFSMMTKQVEESGNASCVAGAQLPDDGHRALQVFQAGKVPVNWHIKSVAQMDVVMMASCANHSIKQAQSHYLKTIYYLAASASSKNHTYTLYKKTQGYAAIPLMDQIKSWQLQLQTTQSKHAKNNALAWQVTFQAEHKVITKGRAAWMTRRLFGYAVSRQYV